MIKVGIIGAAGYTAGELIRLLRCHPMAEVVFAQSGSHAGEPVWKAHHDLVGDTDFCFCKEVEAGKADCIFICSGHGKSKEAVHALPHDYRGAIIDLSNDFRLAEDAEDFIYGLPEAFRDDIKQARHIANPGCFATCIQLALLPAAKAGILSDVHVTGITGATGAGQKPGETTHFAWRDNNLSIYKPFSHQHLGEIKQTIATLSPQFKGEINFVPMRGNFSRGILSSIYFTTSVSEADAVALYKEYYATHPFVTVVESDPDLKMVVNTNKNILHVKKHGDKLHIISVIDNLLKGASGQAVQNMNLIFGLPEDSGLRLKASNF